MGGMAEVGVDILSLRFSATFPPPEPDMELLLKSTQDQQRLCRPEDPRVTFFYGTKVY